MSGDVRAPEDKEGRVEGGRRTTEGTHPEDGRVRGHGVKGMDFLSHDYLCSLWSSVESVPGLVVDNDTSKSLHSYNLVSDP